MPPKVPRLFHKVPIIFPGNDRYEDREQINEPAILRSKSTKIWRKPPGILWLVFTPLARLYRRFINAIQKLGYISKNLYSTAKSSLPG